MLRIAPAGLVGLDIGSSAIVEAHRARGFDLLRGILSFAAMERVDSVRQQYTLCRGFPSRICEANFREPSETHFARFAVEHVAQTPTLCALAADAQIEPATVRVHAGPGRGLDLARGQPIEFLPPNPTNYPTRICGITADCGERVQTISMKNGRKIGVK